MIERKVKNTNILLIGSNLSGKRTFLVSLQHILRFWTEFIDFGKEISIKTSPETKVEEYDKVFYDGRLLNNQSNKIDYLTFDIEIGGLEKNTITFFCVTSNAILEESFDENPLFLKKIDGIILFVDPLSDKKIVQQCQEIYTNIENNTKNDIESLVIQFLNMYFAINGQNSASLFNTPVSVVLSKSDLRPVNTKLKALCGFEDENELFYRNELATYVGDASKKILIDMGLSNALLNVEGSFNNVFYYPISSVGHTNEQGLSYDPKGVIAPLLFILEHNTSNLLPFFQTLYRYTTDKFPVLQERQYQQAKEYYKNNQIKEALLLFSELHDYKDAVNYLDRIKAVLYNKGIDLIIEERYEESYLTFLLINYYKNVGQIINMLTLIQDGDYKNAFVISRRLGIIVIETALKEYLYKKAIDCSEDNPKEATTILNMLGNYKDSKKKINDMFLPLIKEGERQHLFFADYHWSVLYSDNQMTLLIMEEEYSREPYNIVSEDTTWEKCSLRNDVLAKFYDNLETDNQKILLNRRLRREQNEAYGTSGGDCSGDIVSILSIQEAADCMDRTLLNNSGFMWLRNPGGAYSYAAIIDKSGKIQAGGNKVTNHNGIVRPVIAVNSR